MKYSRNEFLRLAGFGIPAMTGLNTGSSFFDQPVLAEEKFNYGLASYTLRKFSLDDTIRMSLRLGLTGITLKAMHMPLESSPDQIRTIAEKVRNAGLNLYGAGVIYMKTEEELESAFAYAGHAGLQMIVGVPSHELLPKTEALVKKTNIKMAIHNHGPGDKLYSSPNDVHEKIRNLDSRIGFCIDIGHVQRIGQDPTQLIEKYKDRLFDMHMKDVMKVGPEDSVTEVGRGIIDIPRVLKTLKKINYQGSIAFEYEKDGDDPLPGLAESVGYVKGVARMI